MSDVCPHCGGPPASVSPGPAGTAWAVCGRCGMSYQAVSAAVSGGVPFAGSAPASPPGLKKRGFGGCLMAFISGGGVLIPLIAIFSPRACTTINGSHQVAIEALAACPSAEAVLGQDIEAAWLGTTSGEESSGTSSGSARWNTTVTGSLGRGDYAFSATKDHMGWHLLSGTLTARGQVVRVPEDCGRGLPGLAGGTPSPTPLGVPGQSVFPGAAGGACAPLQRCCDATRGEANMRGLCQSMEQARGTVAEGMVCAQLRDAARQVLAAQGSIPPECN